MIRPLHHALRLGLLLALALGLRANSLVQFRTSVGDVEVELLDQEKPATVANFRQYVDAGAYRDSFFHRAVHNFVLQGGGFRISNRATTSVESIPTFPPVTNEFTIGPRRSNVAGTLAMAKTANPNSATSQFFFNLVDNSASLDNTNNSGGFTVFGLVRGDTNILASLNLFKSGPLTVTTRTTNANNVVVTNISPATNVIVNAGGVFAELPLLRFQTNAAGFIHSDALVYVDITFLGVAVKTTSSGGHAVSWDAAPGGTNWVEFTTVFPPAWQTLTHQVRPPAGRVTVEDPTPDPHRFYRVRVDY